MSISICVYMDMELVFTSSPFVLISPQQTHISSIYILFKVTYFKSSELYIQLENRSCCITNACWILDSDWHRNALRFLRSPAPLSFRMALMSVLLDHLYSGENYRRSSECLIYLICYKTIFLKKGGALFCEIIYKLSFAKQADFC